MHADQYEADTLGFVTTPRTRPAHSATRLRTTARAAALALVAGLVLVASPALADVPSGWPDPPSVPLLRGLLVYVFAPVALFVLIAVLTVAPSWVRGERSGPGTAEDQWFGGRRGGPDELEAGSPERTSGGASGSW